MASHRRIWSFLCCTLLLCEAASAQVTVSSLPDAKAVETEIARIQELVAASAEAPQWDRDGLDFRIDERLLALHTKFEGIAERSTSARSAPETDGAESQLLEWMDATLSLSMARLDALENRIEAERGKYDEFENSPVGIISRAFVQDLRDVSLRHLRAVIEQLEQRQALGLPDAAAVRERLEASLSLTSQQLAGQIRLDAMTLAELRERATVDPSQAGLVVALGAVERKQTASLDLLRPLIGLLDRLDNDTAELRALQARQSGLLGAGILDGAVLANVLKERVELLYQTFAVDAPSLILRVLAFIMVLVLTWLVARGVRAFVYHLTSRESVELGQLREKTLVSLSFAVVFLVGMVAALSTLGISLLPMLAGLGVASIIVGLALQESLGNLASGGMILATRPFDLHDHVRIGDAEGTVHDMSLVATSVSGFDSTLYIIPNRQVWNATILNFSSAKFRRIELDLPMPYDTDVVEIERLLRGVLGDESRILDKPASRIRVRELGESSLTVRVTAWVKSKHYHDVSTALKREVMLRLQQVGITLG